MSFHFEVPVAGDNRYAQAKERRSQILAEIQRLQAELRNVNEFMILYERLFQDVPIDDGIPAPERKKRERNILPPRRLAELCREILAEAKRPMNRSELLGALQSRGIPLTGSNPSKNLGTILWRFNQWFESVPGRGYWLAGVALPEETA